MTTPWERTSARWQAAGRPAGAFGVVAGFAAGILVAALLVPSHGGGVLRASAGAGPGAAAGGPAGPDAGTAGAAGGAGVAGSVAGGASAGSSTGAAGASRTTGPALGSGTATGPAGVAPPGAGSPIVIAITYPDLGALKALGPSYDNGNVPQEWDALLKGWRDQKLVPVNGHDIVFKYHSYAVLDASAQRSACVAATTDDHAFAVIGTAYFSVGAPCVAAEHHTPLITGDGAEAPAFAQSAPYMFSIDQNADRQLENFMTWANSRNQIAGHRIGLYYANDPDTGALVSRTIKASIARFGGKIAAESTTGDGNGGPEDALAVQNFQTHNVDVAILLTSKTGFLQAAQGVGYKPAFLESDYLYGTADVTTSTYPASEFDGTYGITTQTNGLQPAGMQPTPGMQACISNYNHQTGQNISDPTTALYGYVLIECDEGDTLLSAIRSAGANLTTAGLISALQGLGSFELRRWIGTGTYSAGKHDSANAYRTVQWRAGCKCWVAVSPAASLPVSD